MLGHVDVARALWDKTTAWTRLTRSEPKARMERRLNMIDVVMAGRDFELGTRVRRRQCTSPLLYAVRRLICAGTCALAMSSQSNRCGQLGLEFVKWRAHATGRFKI
jgi:hypothetical protein